MQPDDSRPPLADSFRGDGSVRGQSKLLHVPCTEHNLQLRAGTQSLIQALQVMGPWMEEHGESKSDSDDDDPEHHCMYHIYLVSTMLIPPIAAFTLSSSIHTIHRPVARIRKREQSHAAQGKPEPFIPEEADSDEDESYEEEEEDFDHNASILGSRLRPSDPKQSLHHSITFSEGSTPTPKGTLSRTPSLSTVRIQRRTRLAEKLKEVFEVQDIQEVTSGLYFALKYPCDD
jgi:sterol 3beta-glucosyltransferase